MSEIEIQHERVHTNGIELHVAMAGPEDGPLLLLLHGFPECWISWLDHIPRFAEAGFRVIVPDQRGYNTSDKPEGLNAYALDVLAADIRGLIESQGRDKAFVVAHDWGAAAAWWFALRYPEATERLIIINVPHPIVMERTVKRDPRQLLRSWYIMAFQLPSIPEKMLARRDGLDLSEALERSARPNAFPVGLLEAYREAWRQPGALTAMVNWYRAALRRPPKSVKDLRIKPKTLIIWGAKDAFLRVEMAKKSLDLCLDARLEMFDTATHWVHHEEAEKVDALILEFLRAA